VYSSVSLGDTTKFYPVTFLSNDRIYGEAAHHPIPSSLDRQGCSGLARFSAPLRAGTLPHIHSLISTTQVVCTLHNGCCLIIVIITLIYTDQGQIEKYTCLRQSLTNFDNVTLILGGDFMTRYPSTTACFSAPLSTWYSCSIM
jgi:hypothetical protein